MWIAIVNVIVKGSIKTERREREREREKQRERERLYLLWQNSLSFSQ